MRAHNERFVVARTQREKKALCHWIIKMLNDENIEADAEANEKKSVFSSETRNANKWPAIIFIPWCEHELTVTQPLLFLI